MANMLLGFINSSLIGAGSLALLRYKEILDGIGVMNRSGYRMFRNSKVAARKGIFQTALTRIFLPLPVLLIP